MLGQKMIKLLIFDFDGVIITGSNEGYFRCYHKALESAGVVLNPDEERKKILEKWGKGYKIQIEYLLKDSKYLIPKVIFEYEKCYKSQIFHCNIKLVDGTKDALAQLSKQYVLTIASGMMRVTLERYLSEFKIAQYFKIVSSSEDIKKAKNKKPAPYMINMILNRLNYSANEALYIGDGMSDIEMAKNAEVEPVVVLSGQLTKKEAKSLHISKIVKDITFLGNVL